jgi:hypothetical protein
MDGLPAHDRVSIRGILVSEGEDPGVALAEAGFVDSPAIPAVPGEDLDLSGGIPGNGIAPNPIAVPGTEQRRHMAGTCPGAAESTSNRAQPSEPVATMLPAAYCMHPPRRYATAAADRIPVQNVTRTTLDEMHPTTVYGA